MDERQFSIIRNPKILVYKKLIECGCIYCSRFLLIKRPTIRTDQKAEDVFDLLKPWLLTNKESNRWPGTKLCDGQTADVREYSLNQYTKKILIQSSPSLYSWQQPFLPEDLCLLRNNGQPWLVTIAHEKEAYLVLESEEKDSINTTIPDLLLHEGEVVRPAAPIPLVSEYEWVD